MGVGRDWKEEIKKDHQGRRLTNPQKGRAGVSTQLRGQVCVGSGLKGRREEQEKQIIKT